MGEAIITSRSGGIGVNGDSSAELKTVIIKQSDTFIVPKARNQQFSVRIFGGGGGGGGQLSIGSIYGGGGGWMNNAILTINQGDIVQVFIGKGGAGAYVSNEHGSNAVNGSNGGTTSFGTYLSALGGYGANGGGYTGSGGGDGGSGGGAIGGSSRLNGGTGYQFGGGGGNGTGGNGGKWGGGGSSGVNRTTVFCGGCLYENSQNTKEITGYSGLAGNGYANTTSGHVNATDGVNTIGMSEVPEALQGSGFAGVNSNNTTYKYRYCGGGGYGGCGGNYYGGGGGYGANGGSYGGGGGGYGGHGGNHGGGGGGYGPGGDGPSEYGYNGKIPTGDGIFGGGGGGHNNGQAGNGGDGICIIQYYSA